jgi:hypothetical protein
VIQVNPLNAELNPICHLLTLLGTHPILHISRIRVKFNFITFSRSDKCRKQITDVGKYSFLNRIISWNQLPAGLLASFPCKLNTFRKRVKNVVTSKGLGVAIECE